MSDSYRRRAARDLRAFVRELHELEDPRPPLARLRALTSFFGSAALLGLGFAMVDQTQSGSDPFYYYGFATAFLGILFLFSTSESALFRPLGAFAGGFLAEIYGVWNLCWTIFDLSICGGCHIRSEIALANLGALWPWNGGVIDVPISVFVATTAVAIVGPVLLAHVLPHDVVVRRKSSPPGSGP